MLLCYLEQPQHVVYVSEVPTIDLLEWSADAAPLGASSCILGGHFAS
jgi:hypothetical protein